MRFTAIFLLALISLNAVFAVSLRKNSDAMKTSFALERLRFVGKQSAIAKQVVSAVELHLTSGGKVQEVIELVQAAYDDVHNRRVALQSEFDGRVEYFNGIISNTENQLAEQNSRLSVVNENIDRLHGEIEISIITIENLIQELANLDQHEENVINARNIDIQTYETRKQRDQNSLTVLEQIIQKLLALQARGNAFLQVSKKEIERILTRIPKSNPIQALVQLSTKFDPERLHLVITKLQSIQSAIQASSIEDAAGEESSKAHYEALIAEIDSLRAQKKQQLNDARATKEQAEADLRQFENEKGVLVELIITNEGILAQAKADLESAISSYTTRLAEADEALKAIQLALDVLKQNQSDLEHREENADVVENYVNSQ